MIPERGKENPTNRKERKAMFKKKTKKKETKIFWMVHGDEEMAFKFEDAEEAFQFLYDNFGLLEIDRIRSYEEEIEK